jgi:hypothetical protein
MSDPSTQSTPTPRWVLKDFQLTVPFRMEGELEYQSWSDLERTLSGDITFGSLPQLSFEFGQSVSRVQGGLGLQLWQTELPRIGPFVAEVGMGAMTSWAEGLELELNSGLDLRTVQWPSFRFSIEGAMGLSGLNHGGQPQLGAEITGNLRFDFDIFAPRGTFRRRRE